MVLIATAVLLATGAAVLSLAWAAAGARPQGHARVKICGHCTPSATGDSRG